MKKLGKILVLLLVLTVAVTCLIACGEHKCNFDKKVAESTYFCSGPTCTKKALYFYSCECGNKGTKTFESGDLLSHSFTNYVPDGNATYFEDGTKTAVCDRGCMTTDVMIDVGSKLKSEIYFNTLAVLSSNSVFGKVSNSTTVFSFINEVTVRGSARFEVSLDIYGINKVGTKTIPLDLGMNVVYVTEYINDEPKTVYEVVVYRRSICEVIFDANGGTFEDGNSTDFAYVEEDSLVEFPIAPTREGYAFAGWTQKFTTPINMDTRIYAKWTANTNIPYTVEYYLQNLENDGYTLSKTVAKNGASDAIVNADIENIPHFTYKETGTASGNIASDGSTVLKVYYTRDEYIVTFNGNGGRLVSGKSTQKIRYGGNAVAPTFEKEGHTFEGFSRYDFTNISESFVVAANWTINQYTLTIKYGNGQEDYIITRDYGATIPYIENPSEREGYDFRWDKKIPTEMPAGDVTVTGMWDAIYVVDSGFIGGFTEYGKKNYTKIEIPEEIDGVEIVRVFGFYDCTFLTSVSIPDSVTSIGSDAFHGCTSLKEVIIGKNSKLESIGEFAFALCPIESLTIPASTKNIYGNAFYDCGSLESIYYFGTVDQWVEINCYDYFGSSYSNPLEYANYLYIDDKLIENVLLTTATKIRSGAFYNLKSIKSISISDSVTTIGESAFYNTAYYNDDSNWEDGVLYIDNHLIKAKTSISESYMIKDGTKTIASGAFSCCSALSTIIIPDSVTSIGALAFYDCTALNNVNYKGTIDQWVEIGFSKWYLPMGEFGGCGNPLYYASNLYINDVLVEDALFTTATSISDCAFFNYSLLKSITIPDSVTSVGEWAFYGCDSLTIYCEVESKPSGWYSDWNKVDWNNGCPVVWGYKG